MELTEDCQFSVKLLPMSKSRPMGRAVEPLSQFARKGRSQWASRVVNSAKDIAWRHARRLTIRPVLQRRPFESRRQFLFPRGTRFGDDCALGCYVLFGIFGPLRGAPAKIAVLGSTPVSRYAIFVASLPTSRLCGLKKCAGLISEKRHRRQSSAEVVERGIVVGSRGAKEPKLVVKAAGADFGCAQAPAPLSCASFHFIDDRFPSDGR
jgi:hypothetical protein